MTEERVGELKDKAIEIVQGEKQKKDFGKWMMSC